jgi:4a-hydroxytetrahydrobiopterin dehydratase
LFDADVLTEAGMDRCGLLAALDGWIMKESFAAQFETSHCGGKMKAKKLTEKQMAEKLEKLPGWAIKSGNLHRSFEFADFNEAFGFMTRAALIAESMGHHPDWSNVWNKVDVKLSTHSIGGLSNLDFQLATKMQKLL